MRVTVIATGFESGKDAAAEEKAEAPAEEKKEEPIADDEFEFNVSLYTSDALTKAMHTNELKPNGKTNIRIDYKVSGIGSNSCGPELIEKYRLSEKDISFKFYMK